VSAGTAQLLSGILSAIVVVEVAIGVALARLVQRLARVEEWQRLHNGNGRPRAPVSGGQS
jgi:hypothetical protein